MLNTPISLSINRKHRFRTSDKFKLQNFPGTLRCQRCDLPRFSSAPFENTKVTRQTSRRIDTITCSTELADNAPRRERIPTLLREVGADDNQLAFFKVQTFAYVWVQLPHNGSLPRFVQRALSNIRERDVLNFFVPRHSFPTSFCLMPFIVSILSALPMPVGGGKCGSHC